jgi:hypothetical protein
MLWVADRHQRTVKWRQYKRHLCKQDTVVAPPYYEHRLAA